MAQTGECLCGNVRYELENFAGHVGHRFYLNLRLTQTLLH